MYDDLVSEVKFKFSPSSGHGGQNVNKVSTRVELRFNILDSHFLTNDQKSILINKLYARISSDNNLIVVCDETRSQGKNREIVVRKFVSIIKTALAPVKKRKPTKPTQASKEKRLKDKKRKSDKKNYRREDFDD